MVSACLFGHTSVQELWDIRLAMDDSQLLAAVPNEIYALGEGYFPGKTVPFVKSTVTNYIKTVVYQDCNSTDDLVWQLNNISKL